MDDYDERRMKGRLEALEPLALLQHLMEEGGLNQVDLVDCFGSQSVVSAVMAGERQINSDHARRLSRRFGLHSPCSCVEKLEGRDTVLRRRFAFAADRRSPRRSINRDGSHAGEQPEVAASGGA